MKILIDTNIFIRALLDEHAQANLECRELFRLVNKQGIDFFTSDLVISEIVWVLTRFYGIDKNTTIKYVKGILSQNYKYITNYNRQLALYYYSQYSAKYIDCVLSSIDELQKHEMIVVSYDKDFDKLGVVRKEPRQVIKEIKNQISKH
ncbi:PIN domain-containing protein [Candidatus Dojkabacteria bacterium]|nr:PIN domain-containing protein [Candidatus Dojkabacteria bacterium]